jgi:hypothetical protein
MKYIFIICIVLIGCKGKQSNSATNEILINKIADSIQLEWQNNTLSDTSNISSSPVLILKATLVNDDYTNYKNISVTYKNISNKKIDAVRFKWYAENSFNEPADMGQPLIKGYGGGVDDNALNAGKSRTNTWEIRSHDAKKNVKAWPYQIIFSDGTKWDVSE